MNYLGPKNVRCPECAALMWELERTNGYKGVFDIDFLHTLACKDLVFAEADADWVLSIPTTAEPRNLIRCAPMAKSRRTTGIAGRPRRRRYTACRRNMCTI